MYGQIIFLVILVNLDWFIGTVDRCAAQFLVTAPVIVIIIRIPMDFHVNIIQVHTAFHSETFDGAALFFIPRIDCCIGFIHCGGNIHRNITARLQQSTLIVMVNLITISQLVVSTLLNTHTIRDTTKSFIWSSIIGMI